MSDIFRLQTPSLTPPPPPLNFWVHIVCFSQTTYPYFHNDLIGNAQALLRGGGRGVHGVLGAHMENIPLFLRNNLFSLQQLLPLPPFFKFTIMMV